MSVFLIPQAIDRSADRFPEREALRLGDQSLTYAELAARTNSLARLLRGLGLQRGDRVGIYMNKSIESVISLYGIMKAGGAYVPLDPFAPVNRLSFVIKDCGIKTLLTKEQKLDEIHELVADGTGLQNLIGLPPQDDLPVQSFCWEEVFHTPSMDISTEGITEQDLAYILYTSGSTGTPKGIMHTHRSGLSFAEWARHTYGLTENDRLSNHAPLHFDLSTFDYFAGALAGAATVIISEGLTKFPASLSKMMETERISVWYSVPYALIQLLERGGLPARKLDALRWILFAGEVFPTKHLRQLMAALPGIRFSNLYGPTETNVCTYYHVDSLPEDSDETIPIGIPCENVEDLVVDADGKPVPPGEVGELLIRGGVVMRGYWGRPDLSERGFFKRPSLGYLEDTFYRTGDLVQRLPDGNYKYLGRKDRQIKTRGYRVELDEIEVALLSHDDVQEAAVFPVPDGQGSNLIEAAVIPKPGLDITEEIVIAHIAKRLPPYAVPVKISIMQDFPRTSTGKIDRRALQALVTPSAG